jgi:hypothetical protein
MKTEKNGFLKTPDPVADMPRYDPFHNVSMKLSDVSMREHETNRRTSGEICGLPMEGRIETSWACFSRFRFGVEILAWSELSHVPGRLINRY